MPNLKEEELVERIKKFKVFSELSEEHLHDIVANSSLCTYNKKFSLYSEGSSTGTAYLIVSGSVDDIKYRDNDSVLVITTARAEGWIGLAESYLHGGYLSNPFTNEKSEIMLFSSSQLHYLLGVPKFKKIVEDAVYDYLDCLHHHLKATSVPNKLIEYIKSEMDRLEDGQNRQNRLFISATHEHIARSIGTTRESVTRYLSILQDIGLIRKLSKQIEVLNPKGMHSIDYVSLIDYPH